MKRTLLTVLIITLAFGFSGCGKKVEKAQEQVAYVKVEAPVLRDFSDKLSLPATLKAKNEASVNSNMAAMVQVVNVRVGDKVSKGQVLAVLDSQVASKSYEKAKIGFQNVEKTYNRLKNLYEEGAISQADFEGAKVSYDTVSEDYNLAKLNLSYTKITAPMSGVIGARNIDVGQMAAPGQEAFRIVDLSNLIAESGVSENDIAKLQYGQKVNIILESGEKYEGKIDTISPVTNQMTGTYPVSVSIGNPDGKLKSDMFANIEIIFGTKTGSVAVNNTSVVNEDGQYFLFLANTDKAEKRKVQIGLGDEGFTEITEGITTGDKVISSGQEVLKDGDKIKVITED